MSSIRNKNKKNTKKNTKKNDNDLPILLKEIQHKSEDKINNEESKLMKEASEIINDLGDKLFYIVTEDIPNNFLEMRYKDFIEKQDSSICTFPSLNDTMMVIQDICNKVKTGNASPETIQKYKDIKKISK